MPRKCCCGGLVCCGDDPASPWYLGSDPTTTTVDINMSGLPNVSCGSCSPSDCLNGGVTLTHLSTSFSVVTYSHSCGSGPPADGGTMELNVVIQGPFSDPCEDIDFGDFNSCTYSGGYCARLKVNPSAGGSRYERYWQGRNDSSIIWDDCVTSSSCVGMSCGPWTVTINSFTINIA